MVIKLVGVIVTSVVALFGLLIANGIYFFNKFKSYVSDITSKSFLQVFRNIYNIIPVKNKITVLVQVLVLLATSAGFIVYSIKAKKKPKISKLSFKSLKKSRTRTDLDNLYKLLQDRKEVSVGDIERTFEISNDIAMEWCKILENGELAIIDYPTFKKPVIRLPEEGDKEIEKGNPLKKEDVEGTEGDHNEEESKDEREKKEDEKKDPQKNKSKKRVRKSRPRVANSKSKEKAVSKNGTSKKQKSKPRSSGNSKTKKPSKKKSRSNK